MGPIEESSHMHSFTVYASFFSVVAQSASETDVTYTLLILRWGDPFILADSSTEGKAASGLDNLSVVFNTLRECGLSSKPFAKQKHTNERHFMTSGHFRTKLLHLANLDLLHGNLWAKGQTYDQSNMYLHHACEWTNLLNRISDRNKSTNYDSAFLRQAYVQLHRLSS
jgi:hypothetical protein